MKNTKFWLVAVCLLTVFALVFSACPGEPGTDPGTDPGTTPGTDPGTTPGTDPGTTPGTDPGTTPGDDPVAVAWTALAANGTANTVTTTALTLTFSADPTTLSANNISVTGATKGALSGTGTTRTLAISDITVNQGQSVGVTLSDPEGFVITPKTMNAAINKASGTTTYTISISVPGGNGTVTVASSTVASGDSVTLTITPNDGYELSNLTVLRTNGSSVTVTNNTFTMPSSDVNVTASFAAINYDISVENDIDNGMITTNVTTAKIGDTVTITIAPDSGYRLKSITAKREDTNTAISLSGAGLTRTFTMPASDVIIGGEFELIPEGTIAVNFEGIHYELIDLTEDYTDNGMYLEINYNGGGYIENVFINTYEYSLGWFNTWPDGFGFWLDWFSPGVYNMSVIIINNGVPYSKDLKFKVSY